MLSHAAAERGLPVPSDAIVSAVARVASSSGTVVFISDMLEDAPALIPVLAEARGRGAHVAAVRIETPAERDFPFDASVHLRDPETRDRRETFGPAARARYLAARTAHREATTLRLHERGIAVVDASTDGRMDEVLARTLDALRRGAVRHA